MDLQKMMQQMQRMQSDMAQAQSELREEYDRNAEIVKTFDIKLN